MMHVLTTASTAKRAVLNLTTSTCETIRPARVVVCTKLEHLHLTISTLASNRDSFQYPFGVHCDTVSVMYLEITSVDPCSDYIVSAQYSRCVRLCWGFASAKKNYLLVGSESTACTQNTSNASLPLKPCPKHGLSHRICFLAGPKGCGT